jgi:two-component system response regulator NreC
VARILVADNDPDAHTVLGAMDGHSALELVDEFGPEVVVLDYRMPPGPTGLAVGSQLRRERPDLRVVIYSNYQSVELVTQAAQVGIAFLPKGNLRTLRAAVRS